jgi:hypothetical protein
MNDVDMPLHWRFQTLYIDGMCHWLSPSDNLDKHFFVSFNLNNDMFTTTILPLDVPTNIVTNFLLKFVQRRLVVLVKWIHCFDFMVYIRPYYFSHINFR